MSSDAYIPLAEPDLRGKEEDYLRQCVQTGWVSTAGPYVHELEERLRALSGCRHAVATASGTTALQLALIALGVRPGQRVIVPDYTFAATVNAVVHCGAVPVMLDVSADNWSLDPALVEAELEASRRAGTPIGAVVAVDPLGLPADFDPLADICQRHGVPLLEDAAGSIGATYKGRPAGSLANAGTFSFNGNKLITGGGGGAIVTDDEAVAKTARHLSTQARVGQRYVHDAIGFNYRLTNLNAAVAVAQLERIEALKAARLAHAAAFTAAVAGRNDMLAPPAPEWAGWNGWMYVLRLQDVAAAESLTAYLESRQIGARPFWQSLSQQAPYAGFPRRLTGVSAKLSGSAVSLPNGSMVTVEQRQRIIEALAGWRG